MAEPALQRGVPLDRLDDRGVVADAGVEAEEAAVDAAEPDRAHVGGVDAAARAGRRRATGSFGRPSVRANTLVEPPGQHAERGVGAGDAGRHLVERAVAAVADDDVDAAPGGVVGEAGGVPAPVGLDELDVVPLRQPPVHHDGVARRHRRGERVDDEQDPQGA